MKAKNRGSQHRSLHVETLEGKAMLAAILPNAFADNAPANALLVRPAIVDASADAAVVHQSKISSAETDSLLFMREEEKLARDVYLELGDRYGAQIFYQIAESETRHTQAVANLLSKYGIADPVVNDQRGEFTNPLFTEMYQQLVQQGSTNILEAYRVGVLIEETDIQDIADSLNVVSEKDIQRVYENLLAGSENHLVAFNNAIAGIGDVNNDGRFDSADLVQVMQVGEYEDGIVGNSTFAEGDWNLDGDFDSADLVLAMQVGHYVPAAVAQDIAAALDANERT
ncbi:MAG: DUF2202 domain-containing protein [Planctomycetales bacterium]|nr:DUF2202 domain-containing protein [Planctomycetales bacterium]